MLGPLTYLDAGLLALALISGLLAMYRGFTREVLSLLSWVMAAGAAAYVVVLRKQWGEEIAQTYGQNTTLVQIGLGAIVFLLTLIIVHLLTARFSDKVLDSQVGMIDRFLGFCFGAVRGFLIVVIAFLFFDFFLPQGKDQFVWIKRSHSFGVINSTGNAIKSRLIAVIPKNLNFKPGEGDDQGPDRAGRQRGEIRKSVNWAMVLPAHDLYNGRALGMVG